MQNSTEPLHENVAIEQRNNTLLAGFGDTNLPDRYRDSEGFSKRWKQAARAYGRHRIGERENQDYGNTLQSRAENKLSQTYSLDRWTRQQYAERHVSLLSLRISPTHQGTYLHPLAQIDLVQDAYSASTDKLYNRLARSRGIDYEYIKILAGTRRFGTCHAHLVIFTDDPVTIEDFKPFCESFVENCAVLDSIEGNVPSKGAVSIQSEKEIEYTEYPGDNGLPVAPCTRYVGSQIPHLKDVDQSSEADLLFGAAINASNRQGFYRSRTVSEEDLDSTLDNPVGSSYEITDPPTQSIPEPTTIVSIADD